MYMYNMQMNPYTSGNIQAHTHISNRANHCINRSATTSIYQIAFSCKRDPCQVRRVRIESDWALRENKN